MTSNYVTTKPLVYVAGKYRGKNAYEIECNIREAEAAGLHLARVAGVVPVIVHSMYRFFQGTLPDDFWLNGTLDILRVCNGIFMLRDWENSSGSKAEHAEASRLGLAIFYDVDYGPELPADRVAYWAEAWTANRMSGGAPNILEPSP